MAKNKVKYGKFKEFETSWFRGEYPNQRLGQAFLNTFMPDVQNGKLFYEEDPKTAIAFCYVFDYIDIT